MSCNQWEAGTITLPSAEAKKVRDAVRAAADKHAKRLYDEAQRFWGLLPAKAKRDPEEYRSWVDMFVFGNNLSETPSVWKNGVRIPNPYPSMPPIERGADGQNDFADDLTHLLHVAGGGYPLHVKPRRIQQKDVNQFMGKITGANPTFRCGEPSITFRGRIVTWKVPEGNHACDVGRVHPIAVAFFDALKRVNWTRGSGGKIVGNNEYNRESRYEGGGSNYVVDEYGPNVRHFAAASRVVAQARWY